MGFDEFGRPQPSESGGWVPVLFQIVLIVLVVLVLFYSVLVRGGFFR